MTPSASATAAAVPTSAGATAAPNVRGRAPCTHNEAVVIRAPGWGRSWASPLLERSLLRFTLARTVGRLGKGRYPRPIAVPRDLSPMLAVSSKTLPVDDGTWAYEMKW